MNRLWLDIAIVFSAIITVMMLFSISQRLEPEPRAISGFEKITGLFHGPGNSTACGEIDTSITLASNVNINETCYVINASNIVLDCADFNITGNGSGQAVNITGFHNITVANCNIMNFETGIALRNNENSTFINNTFRNGTNGILTVEGTQRNNVIRGNSFFDINIGATPTGINFVGGASDNINFTIINNSINNSGFSGIAMQSSASFSQSTISNNVIGFSSIGMDLSNFNHNLVENNTVTYSSTPLIDGIRMLNLATNSTIRNNTLNFSFVGDTGAGISVGDNSVFNITVAGNRIYGDPNKGIEVGGASNTENRVENNTIFTNGSFGISLSSTNLGVVSGNIIQGPTTGISMSSANASLGNNTINNTVIGITITDSNATLGNNIFNNVSTLLNITGPPILTDLLIQNTFGSVNYTNLSINGSVSTEIVNISQNIIAVNSTANPLLNASSRVCMNFTGTCSITPTIYSVPQFTTDLATILTTGTACTSSSDPSCTAISCSGQTLCFNVSHFSSFGVANSTSCGFVNGNVTLNTNLEENGTCFTMNASNVVLDCAGFTVTGNGTGVGVNSTDKENITIRNCNLNNFNIGVLFQSTNNSIVIDTDATNSTGTGSAGARLLSSFNNNLTNILGTTVAIGNGILIQSSSNNTLTNSTGTADVAGSGIQIFSGVNNTVSNSFGQGASNGILLSGSGVSPDSSSNLFINTTAVTDLGIGVSLKFSSSQNAFFNTTIRSNATWLSTELGSSGNNFTNTLFDNPNNGSIRILPNATIPTSTTLSQSLLNISYNRTYVNSSALSYLNTSAEITLRSITFSNPKPTVDFEDDGTFIDCPSTVCTELSFVNNIFVYNVTHFTSYSSAESASAPSAPPSAPSQPSGGGISTPSPVIPPPQVQIPTLPKFDSLQTAINPLLSFPNPYPCVKLDGKEADVNITELKGIPQGLSLAGNQTPVQIFNSTCENKIDITLNLPDNIVDLKAYRCEAGSCVQIEGKPETKLDCGRPFFDDISRKTTFLEPKDFPIRLDQTSSNNELQMLYDGFRLIFSKPTTATINAPATAVREPTNRFSRIVGTPAVITGQDLFGSTRVSMPYASIENVEEDSIALYAYRNNNWEYVGGELDKSSKIVTAALDLSDYVENNQIMLAPIGTFCFNCLTSKLTKFYNGTSRDAVVLIHGLEIAPGRMQDIMNDIALTKQPWQGWVFQYLSNKAINESAKDLADLLEANSNQYDYLYIAAHSMGGIVAQEAIRYADEQNRKRFQYTFVPKIRKIVTVASPNQGTIREGIYKELFEFLIKSETANELFHFNSQVIRELVQGREIPRANGTEYFVIAGTRPYSFVDIPEANDGIITVKSAQLVGGVPIDDRCANFWDINISHTDILNNYDSRRVVERIVAKEVAEFIKDRAVMGYNQYFKVVDDRCSSDVQYVIVGDLIQEEAATVPANCGCGNGVCGVDENEAICPADCARIEAPKKGLLDLILQFVPFRTLLILAILAALGISTTAHVVRERLHKKNEARLSNAVDDLRKALEEGRTAEAAQIRNSITEFYKRSSKHTKLKYDESINQLDSQLLKKL